MKWKENGEVVDRKRLSRGRRSKSFDVIRFRNNKLETEEMVEDLLEKDRCSKSGKVCFDTMREAENALIEIAFFSSFKKWDRIKTEKRVYRCECCDLFHLTSKD